MGNTNRWRIPDSLGGDLLASNQAVKSITVPYNTSMVKIITGELYVVNSLTSKYNTGMAGT